MKRIIKNILPVFIILSLIITGIVIPQNIQGRVWFTQEETFGEPGEDPVLSPEPLITESGGENVNIAEDDYKEIEEMSILKIHFKLLFNQLTGLIF
ncbi:MAG: hypothetical protein GF417_08040 [Candidatus Latescibacteria bacterium]|nr:hypothetical protein [Candidatus Latescibacterota bacterium]